MATPTTAPDQQAGSLQASRGLLTAATTLVKCTPLATERTHKDIDRDGGYIQVGPHVLVIPSGALKRKTRISAEIVPDSTSSVRFGPSGLTFERSATLWLSYAHCEGPPGLMRRVVYTSDALQILKTLPTADDKDRQTVVAPIDHFSRYAVAW
jgi:hypothetical protein